jgi:hypothetical protein
MMIFRNRLIPPRYGTLGDDVPPLTGDTDTEGACLPPRLGVRRALGGSLFTEGEGD